MKPRLEFKDLDRELKDEVEEMRPILESMIINIHNYLIEVEKRNGKWLTRVDIEKLFDTYLSQIIKTLNNAQIRKILVEKSVNLYYKNRQKFID